MQKFSALLFMMLLFACETTPAGDKNNLKEFEFYTHPPKHWQQHNNKFICSTADSAFQFIECKKNSILPNDGMFMLTARLGLSADWAYSTPDAFAGFVITPGSTIQEQPVFHAGIDENGRLCFYLQKKAGKRLLPLTFTGKAVRLKPDSSVELRLFCTQNQGETQVSLSAHNPNTGDVHCFASLKNPISEKIAGNIQLGTSGIFCQNGGAVWFSDLRIQGSKLVEE